MTQRIALMALTVLAVTANDLAAQAGTPIVVARTQSVFELAPYAGHVLSADLKSGPLGTRATIAGGPVYGAQAMLPLLPGAALMANAAYSKSDLEARAPILGGLRVGTSEAWFVDGGIQIGATGDGAGGRPIKPFIQVGAGAIRRTLSVAGLEATATDFAWHAGAGFDVVAVPGVALRAVVRDYVAPFDFQEAIFVDIAEETMHNIALGIGLRFSL